MDPSWAWEQRFIQLIQKLSVDIHSSSRSISPAERANEVREMGDYCQKTEWAERCGEVKIISVGNERDEGGNAGVSFILGITQRFLVDWKSTRGGKGKGKGNDALSSFISLVVAVS